MIADINTRHNEAENKHHSWLHVEKLHNIALIPPNTQQRQP